MLVRVGGDFDVGEDVLALLLWAHTGSMVHLLADPNAQHQWHRFDGLVPWQEKQKRGRTKVKHGERTTGAENAHRNRDAMLTWSFSVDIEAEQQWRLDTPFSIICWLFSTVGIHHAHTFARMWGVQLRRIRERRMSSTETKWEIYTRVVKK